LARASVTATSTPEKVVIIVQNGPEIRRIYHALGERVSKLEQSV
jgi:hypothetical protein